MLESWYIQHNQAALNRERGTLPEVYTALLDWWACTDLNQSIIIIIIIIIVIVIIIIVLFLF